MTISQLCSSDDFFPSVERLFCFIFTARRPVAAGVIYGLPLAAKFGTDNLREIQRREVEFSPTILDNWFRSFDPSDPGGFTDV